MVAVVVGQEWRYHNSCWLITKFMYWCYLSGKKCKMNCEAESCKQVCARGGCELDCEGKYCEQSCPGGKCKLKCLIDAKKCKQSGRQCKQSGKQCTKEVVYPATTAVTTTTEATTTEAPTTEATTTEATTTQATTTEAPTIAATTAPVVPNECDSVTGGVCYQSCTKGGCNMECFNSQYYHSCEQSCTGGYLSLSS